jgi:uncharacterized Zn-binding protein involved in type VI secretion
MGRQIVRVGDVNSAGGAVISGSRTVTMNGLAIALDGSPVTCHPNGGPHTHAHCVASEYSITIEGKKVIYVGDVDSCGHVRIQGSPSVGS